MANVIDPIRKFVEWFFDIWAVIDRPVIQGFDGAVVSIGDIFFGFIILAMIISIFWKGVRV